MTTQFEAFLRSDDLDELLKLRRQNVKLNEEEECTVLTVLEAWSDKQAVANLLFCPSLIPAANRERFVTKGLSDLENPYFVLATVVGVASLAGQTISNDFRLEIKKRLIGICNDYGDVVAERASVSLGDFLEKTDLIAVLPLILEKNNIVSQNILAWVVRTWDNLTLVKMEKEFKAVGISWFKRRRALVAFREFVNKRSEVPSAFKLAPVLSYIPNLKEVER